MNGYKHIEEIHIEFFRNSLLQLKGMLNDDIELDFMNKMLDYYDKYFCKKEQDYLNDVKKIILQMSKIHMGTPLGDEIYRIYQSLKSGLYKPDEAMDKVSQAIENKDLHGISEE